MKARNSGFKPGRREGSRAAPPLNADEETYILEMIQGNPDMDRQMLAEKILSNKKKWHGRLPGKPTVMKRISKYRNIPMGSLDQPWHILSLPKQELSAETLPAVLKVWAYTLKEKIHPLTIREAKWVARLYKLFEKDQIDELYICAMSYAAYEKSSTALSEKAAEFLIYIGFREGTELYIDHTLTPSAEEIVDARRDPERFKMRKQILLQQLRSPETLKLLGLNKPHYFRELNNGI